MSSAPRLFTKSLLSALEVLQSDGGHPAQNKLSHVTITRAQCAKCSRVHRKQLIHKTLVRSAAITRHTSTPFLHNCNVRAPPLQAGSVLLLLLLLTQGYPAGTSTVVTAAAALPQQWLFCLRLDPIKIYLPLVSLTPRKHHIPHTHF
jgi:hypothetical protein